MAKNKKKKTNLSDNVRKSKKNTVVKTNPFEVKINRQKHEVLGRKLTKFDKGKPGASRSKAMKKRNETLLLEYKQRGKANKFVDKRFAENDAEMSLEDKMLKRFALERQKHHEKANIFKLNDDDELTHYGQSLSQIEKFEAPLEESDVEDEDEGRLTAKHVGEEHFGGFFTRKESEDALSTKSWKERMEEMITTTRKARYERQQEREKNLNLTDKLDAELKDIRQLITASQGAKESRGDGASAADDYDIAVRELKFEVKGQPTDRMKTEEELAKEEKERLEKLEADRVRRMKGITVKEEQAKKRVYFSADDLSENFALDDRKKQFEVSYKDGKLIPATEEDESDDSDKEDENDQSEEEVGSGDESGQSAVEDGSGDGTDQSDGEDDEDGDQEDDHSDLESDDEIDESTQAKPSETKKKSVSFKPDLTERPKVNLKERKDMMEQARKELPYTFNVPESYEDLVKLMEGHTEDDKLTIIDRTRKCNHPSLAEGNKDKLQSFSEMLLEYFGELALCDPPEFSALDRLVVHLYELTQAFPQSSAKTLVGILQSIQEEFSEYVQKKGGRGAFPKMDAMLYLKLVAILFPTSDYRHPVVTPAMMMMSQTLTQCPVTTLHDVAAGLFICTLFLEYLSFSKKFVPEVINFLQGILFLAATKEEKKLLPVIAPFKPVGSQNDLLCVQCSAAKVQSKKDQVSFKQFSIRSVLMSGSQQLDTDTFRLQAVHCCLRLVQKYATLYQELPSYREIFAPICDMCNRLPLQQYPKDLQNLVQTVIDLTSQQNGSSRERLVKGRKKPLPLRQYEPSFEDSFDGKRRSGGDRETNEKQRLLHKHKKELKGAVREIKKDNQFLARHQLAERMEKDAERKRKVQEIHHMLATQEGEFNAMKRKKNNF